MTRREEQIAVLREKFQAIQAKAIRIERGKYPLNASQARLDARSIIIDASDAFECCIAILGFPEMERSHTNHLGATSDEH